MKIEIYQIEGRVGHPDHGQWTWLIDFSDINQKLMGGQYQNSEEALQGVADWLAKTGNMISDIASGLSFGSHELYEGKDLFYRLEKISNYAFKNKGNLKQNK